MDKSKGVRGSRTVSNPSLQAVWLRNYIVGAIKKVWSRYAEERENALKAVRSDSLMVKKDGTVGVKVLVHYECAHCKAKHPKANVQVDHIKPIGKQPPWPPIGDGEWDWYLHRVFCEQENLQVLCKPCHKIKSKTERSQGAYE